MAGVDVVIPCYNYGRFLAECVASVLTQAGVDLRVLIVDNASEDDSLAVARTLAAQDRRIEVRAHTTNRGATFSYNAGVEWASADYFLILDADDLLAPGALARAAAVLDGDRGISFTHGVEERMEPDGSVTPFRIAPGPATVRRTGDAFIRELCRTPVNGIGANTVVRRTAAQKRVGHYRPSLPYTDDLEMWLRLATIGDVVSIRAPQAIRRYHPTRMSNHYQSVQVRDFVERERAFESFFENEGGRIPDAHVLLAEARRGLGEHAYWSAVSHLLRGQGRVGAALLGLAHRQLPAGAVMPPFGWLLRMERPFERAATIVREAFRSRRPDKAAVGCAGPGTDPGMP
jgi:glycosyltransferase involved in cell wall biosynthesis